MIRPTSLAAVVALLVAGCGGGAPPQPKERAVAEPLASKAAPPLPAGEPERARSLPDACTDGPMCTPPVEFAERLCASAYPEVALHLFAPKTPWKRAYLQRSFQAWHVGGRGELRELRAGEEVIIVRLGRSAGENLTGGQAFDVLRWDGTCVSLMEDELSFRRPPAAVPANIPWKKLEPAYQAAFFEEKQLETLRAAQVKKCDDPSADKEPGRSKCELARRQLSLAMAQAVGRGMTLPPLSAVP